MCLVFDGVCDSAQEVPLRTALKSLRTQLGGCMGIDKRRNRSIRRRRGRERSKNCLDISFKEYGYQAPILALERIRTTSTAIGALFLDHLHGLAIGPAAKLARGCALRLSGLINLSL